MLTRCYSPDDATRVQGVNDVVIFSVAGAGSFFSGYVYERAGSRALVLLLLLLLIIIPILLLILLK